MSQIDPQLQRVEEYLAKAKTECKIVNDDFTKISIEVEADNFLPKATTIHLEGEHKLISGNMTGEDGFSEKIVSGLPVKWAKIFLDADTKADNFLYTVNAKCSILETFEAFAIPVKTGKVKITVEHADIKITDIKITKDQGDLVISGDIDAPSETLIFAEISQELPPSEFSPRSIFYGHNNDTQPLHDYLWDNKPGDTVYLIVGALKRIEGNIQIDIEGRVEH